MKGQVTSLYDPALGRILLGPDGAVIPTPATVTGGVGEGVAYAVANRWAFKCLPHETIACSGMLTVPSCSYADIDLGSTDFSFSAACNAPGLYLNSYNGGRFKHTGRLIYSGTGTCGMYIAPATPDPVHNQKIIQNAELEFGYVWINGVSIGQGVVIDLSQGSIMNNRLGWLNVNGWDGAHNRMSQGIYVIPSANPYIGFNENMIRVGQMQGFSQTGIVITADPSVTAGDNEWDAMLNTTGMPGEQPSSMVDTCASYDEWRLSMTIFTGSCAHGIVFNAGANHNSYKIRQDTSNNGTRDNGMGNKAI